MERKHIPAYIVCLDLNGLKQINDTYGHSRGDDLIVNFSKILHETFDKYDCAIGRMGGDEFVIVMYDTEEQDLVSALEELSKKICAWNDKQNGDLLSVAYGYAYYDGDKDSGVQAVYSQADQEMYELKRKMKRQMGDMREFDGNV